MDCAAFDLDGQWATPGVVRLVVIPCLNRVLILIAKAPGELEGTQYIAVLARAYPRTSKNIAGDGPSRDW